MKILLLVVCLLGNSSMIAQDTLSNSNPPLFGGKEINMNAKRPLVMIDGGPGFGDLSIQGGSSVPVLRLSAGFSLQRKIMGMRVEATASIGHKTHLLNFQLGPTVGYTNGTFGVFLNPYFGISKSNYYKKDGNEVYSHQSTGLTFGGQLIWEFRLLPSKRIYLGGTFGAGQYAANFGMNVMTTTYYSNGDLLGYDISPGVPNQACMSLFVAFALGKKKNDISQ